MNIHLTALRKTCTFKVKEEQFLLKNVKFGVILRSSRCCCIFIFLLGKLLKMHKHG